MTLRLRALTVVAVMLVATGCAAMWPSPAALRRIDARIGELLLVGFNGTAVDGNVELERVLCEAKVGGVVLFARNIQDGAQLRALTSGMSARTRACAGRSLLIAVDAEGGQVMRLGPRAGFVPTLSHQELGDAGDYAETELEARRIGTMLRDHGINWNLAPVVDVGYNPANPVIVGYGRSFGANPVLVTEHARAWVRGMHAAGVLTAVKHFPGHGSSYGDTHHGFVDVTPTADRDIELVPYRALIAERLADAVMTAHVVNRRLDVHPATLSHTTITGVLRRQLGFQGVVVTDDLRMGAIVQHYGFEEALAMALGAGVDVLLIAEDRLPDGRSASAVAVGAIRRALAEGRIDAGRVEESLARIAALRERVR
ncbi:MAG: glycoside hydrolase family 3 protein [Candidatus Rokubacteria bacterium]|nr:glycoside hydrolase family 3 protein [Candidatus Rokubacteria bacterium]